MAKRILTVSRKGSFELGPDKLKFPLDLPYSPISTEQEVKSPYFTVAVHDVIPVVSLKRVYTDDNKKRFFDALQLFNGETYAIGFGRLDDKGEPVYESNELLGKPVSEIKLSEGLTDEELKAEVDDFLSEAEPEDIEAVEEALAEAGIENAGDYLKENPREALKVLAQNLSKREFRSFFPNVAKAIKGENGYDISKLEPPKTIDLENAEEIPLNYVVVGETPYGEAVMAHSERLKILSPTMVAKELAGNNDYKAVVALSEVRLKDIREKNWKVERLMERAEKASPQVRKLVDELLSAKTEEDVARVYEKAFKVKKELINSVLSRSPLLKPEELLVSKKEGNGYFLRSLQSGVGLPMRSLNDLEGVIYAGVPRPIQVEGKWKVQRVYKPLTMGAKGKRGGVKLIPTKTDANDMFFGYKTYKVLAAMMGISKPGGRAENWTWKQIRALAGEGLGENFKGLEALEKEFSQFKGGGVQWTSFIKYVRDLLGEELFTSDTGNEAEKLAKVKEKLSKDPVVSEFVHSFGDFLEVRRNFKYIPLEAISPEPTKLREFVSKNRFIWPERRRRLTKKAFKERKQFLELAKPLVDAGVIEVDKEGKIHFHEEKLKGDLFKEWQKLLDEGYASEKVVAYHPVAYSKVKEIEKKLKPLLNEGVRPYTAIMAVAAARSAASLIKQTAQKRDEKPDRDARILAGEIRYHLTGDPSRLNLEKQETYGIVIDAIKAAKEKEAPETVIVEDWEWDEEFESKPVQVKIEEKPVEKAEPAKKVEEPAPKPEEPAEPAKAEPAKAETAKAQETQPAEEVEDWDMEADEYLADLPDDLVDDFVGAPATTLQQVRAEEAVHRAAEGGGLER